MKILWQYWHRKRTINEIILFIPHDPIPRAFAAIFSFGWRAIINRSIYSKYLHRKFFCLLFGNWSVSYPKLFSLEKRKIIFNGFPRIVLESNNTEHSQLTNKLTNESANQPAHQLNGWGVFEWNRKGKISNGYYTRWPRNIRSPYPDPKWVKRNILRSKDRSPESTTSLFYGRQDW